MDWDRNAFPAIEAYHRYPDGRIVPLADGEATDAQVGGLIWTGATGAAVVELPPPDPLPPPVPPVPPPVSARQHEVLGVWLQLLWFPVGLFGLLLVLTLDGSVVGMPLVLLALPPFTAGRMRRRGGRAPRSLLAAGFVGTAVVATMGAWILILRRTRTSVRSRRPSTATTS